MTPLATLPIVILTLWAGYLVASAWTVRRRSLQRLYADDPRVAGGHDGSMPKRWLGRWLMLAGYRRPGAVTLFITATAVLAAVGVVAGQFYRAVLERSLVEMVVTIPGGAGEVLAAVLRGGPWILFFLAALAPATVVRAARRKRALAVEQDLPLALELFATMGEAGLGFDAALAKIVRVEDLHRPLISEFAHFQRDMLAGVPRPQALRQLSRRVEVTPLTSFTSALIQAEQIGASMAETLRHQADDLRQRRREQALLEAQALPVKLVFPLVICFLPGIFISTLAPVIYQMIQVASGVIGHAGR